MAHIIEITDFSAPELDIYARLTENQLVNRADPENALFVAESPLVIGRALDAGCTPVSFLMERKHIEGKGAEVLARCPADIPVYAADLPVLTQLTGFHLTRGMLCAMRRPRLPSVAEACADARRIAVLENIMNPTNIGAIFRSAAALNVDAVLLTAAGSDPLYRRAARVSMGNVFLVPWTYLPEGESWPELLHELGFKTVALALRDDSLALNDPRLLAEPKLAMVLGTEGDGLLFQFFICVYGEASRSNGYAAFARGFLSYVISDNFCNIVKYLHYILHSPPIKPSNVRISNTLSVKQDAFKAELYVMLPAILF